MALLGFTLPPDSGEKLSLGKCVMSSALLLLLYISIYTYYYYYYYPFFPIQPAFLLPSSLRAHLLNLEEISYIYVLCVYVIIMYHKQCRGFSDWELSSETGCSEEVGLSEVFSR